MLSRGSSKWNWILIILLLVVAAGGSRIYSQSGILAEKTETKLGRRIGIVDLKKIRQQHPTAGQLNSLQQELTSRRMELQNQQEKLAQIKETSQTKKENFTQQVKENLAGLEQKYKDKLAEKRSQLTSQLKEHQQKIQQKMDRKLTQFRQELKSKIEDQIQQKKQKLKTELTTRKKQINQKYNSRIINLRIKLQTGTTAKTKADKYKAKLSKLTSERSKQIAQVKREYQTNLQEFVAAKEETLKKEVKAKQKKLVQQAEKDYQEYRKKLAADWETEAAKLKQKWETEINNHRTTLKENWADNLTNTKQSLVQRVTSKIKKSKEQIKQLTNRLQQIKSRREASIDTAIKQLAQQQNLKVVVTTYQQKLSAVDLTAEVIDLIKQEGVSNNEETKEANGS